MEYRFLGRSGLQVSALGFGSWITFANQLDVNGAAECMAAAYDAGVNLFDTAEVYAFGNAERVMGQALRQLGWSRDTFLLSSKVYFGSVPNAKPTQRGLSRKHIVEGCHQSLSRLQVDYLDLFFCHRPDPQTPIEETVRAMSNLVQQGKILYWGTSEWSAQQIMEAYSIARQYHLVPPSVEQTQYNLVRRERVELEYARLPEAIGLGIISYSPLALGLLSGKYSQGLPQATRFTLPGYHWLKKTILDTEDGRQRIALAARLAELAKDVGLPLAQLAIAWCLKQPLISSVLLGASSKEQLLENLQTSEAVARLTDDVMMRIEELLGNKPELEVGH